MSESRQHLSAYTKNEKSKAESIRHGSKDCQYERRDSRDDRKDSRYDSRGRHDDRKDSRYDSRGRHEDRNDSRYDSRGRHEDRNDSHYDRRDSRHESRDSPYGRRNSVRDVKNHHHVQKPEPRKLTSHVHPSQRSDQRYPTRVPGDQMLNQGPRSGAPGCGSCVAFPNSSNGTCDSCGKVCRVGSHHDVQGRKCCTGCWDRWWSEKDRNVRSAMMASERDSLKRRLPCKTVEWNALQVELQNTFVYQYNLCIEKDENVREIMRKKLILSYLRCVLDKEYLRSLDIILSGNVFYCIEDIREKLQEPLLREVGLGSFKTTIELRISETSRLQLNPRTNEEQSLQVYNHVLGKIFESLNLKRSGKVYCDETRQRVYRDMIIVPGYFATLQMSPMGIVLVVHPRTRVQATMTALEWMKRAEFSSRDLLGRKVIASYGARQRQYIVYKIDKESTPESTFELKSGATISYAQYYLDNYGVTVTDMRQPLLWGERSGRVRLIPELVLVDQLSSEARRCLPSRCSKMPLEIRNECVALANRLTESTPKEMFSTYGLNVDASKLLRVEPKLLKPVRIMLSGVCDNIRPHCDFGSQTLRIVLKEERRPFLVIAWGDKSKDVVSRILGVNERINGVLKVHGDVRYVGGSEEHSDFIDQCIDSVKTADARASSEQGVPILVLCVLKNGHSIRGSEAYGTLKYELGQLGIMSHFMDYEKISKTRSLEPYIHNVTKNITSKMGVPLWNVDLPQLIPCLQGGTLYVGYDIFSDRRSDGTDSGVFECQIRSIAGYVAWFHRDDGKWLHFCDTDMQIEKQRIETFNDDFHPITKSCDVPMTSLRDFVTEVIKAIVCGSTVSRIVVYRDSVSDSMIERVRSNEMNALEASLPNTVAMTFLVVQKRVHDRYAAQVRVGPNTEWHNVPRGHVIEHTEDCFSCIAVDCTLAAAKPIKYFILRSGGMQRDDIHNMTYALCWMYQNWPGSIKVPFVLQCAHKLAFFHGTSSAAKPNVEFNLRKMPYYL